MSQVGAAPSRTAVIPGPVPGTRLTDSYVRDLARYAYFWARPMINVYNRLLAYEKLPGPGLAGGVLPVGPPNHLGMLHDYIEPSERAVACPNQDVVYGQCVLALDREPVVVQVPDFGDRFWVYQIVDQRTDGFATIGKMYGTKPGFYLLAGSDWNKGTPRGINGVFQSTTKLGMFIPRVFQSTTKLGMFIPRVFMDDTPEDRAAIQQVINQIDAYPLSAFDGHAKRTDWTKSQKFPGDTGSAEVKWVKAELFAAQLPVILDQVPPLTGEDAIHQQFRALVAAADKEPRLKQLITEAATAAEEEVVKPLFQFRNYGLPLPHNWTTMTNGAQFGTDYYTRTAVAKSNILVNKPNETRYFYQDLDAAGQRLRGDRHYRGTFAKDQLPPVRGFWSMTLYNEHHFFHPNDLKRYSLGTKNSKTLQRGADGSLTLYVGATPPAGDLKSNWLPAPNSEFSLYVRSYWPEAAISEGRWTPPAVVAS
jgi:hypothetical protein